MSTTLHRPRAAGIVAGRHTQDGWRVLVVRAKRAWEFPNGGVSPGEDPLEAAQRQAREGTGLTDIRFPFGPVYREPAPNSRQGIYPRYYIAVTEQEQITLQPAADTSSRPEHEEARWVSFDDASKLLPQRLNPTLNWARRVLSK